MKLDYSLPEKLRVCMREYIKELISTFPEKLSENIKSLLTTILFNINGKTKSLDEHRKEIFHTYVMKYMVLAKRARSDSLVGISFLSTRVIKSNEEDWIKLVNYLKNIKEILLRLETD